MIKFTRYYSKRGSYSWLIFDTYEKIIHSNEEFLSGTLYYLGSGELPYKEYFLSHADRYVAVGWAGSFHTIRADIDADLSKPLPIDSEVADSIVSLSVLEKLYERQLMINEAFRILRKGGSIVLQVPWQWWVHLAPHDYFRYTPYGLQHLLKRAGVVEIEARTRLFTTLILKMHYFSLRLIRGPKIIRILVGTLFALFWHLGQLIAPLFDRLDRNWELEAPGYFVTVHKP